MEGLIFGILRYLVLETFDQKKQARQMVIGMLGYR